MDSSAVPGFIPSLKEPRGLSPGSRGFGTTTSRGPAALEQRVHRLDHRHALGCPVQRDDLLHRPRDLSASSRPSAGRSCRRRARWSCIPNFWTWSLPERRAWFVKEVMVNHVPQEILPGDLIAGGALQHPDLHVPGRKRRARSATSLVYGKKGARAAHEVVPRPRLRQRRRHQRPPDPRATSGPLTIGWKGIHADLVAQLQRAWPRRRQTRTQGRAAPGHDDGRHHAPRPRGEIRAALPRPGRRREGRSARRKRARRRWRPIWTACPGSRPTTFWEAVQALWLNHMLVMSDENYPGPGVSFGRIDQYLLPYWEHSLTRAWTGNSARRS